MKAKCVTLVLALVLMLTMLTGCQYEFDFNWPVTIIKKTEPPTPKPTACIEEYDRFEFYMDKYIHDHPLPTAPTR